MAHFLTRVKSLSNVIRDLEDVVTDQDFSSQQSKDLQDILAGCSNVLTDLDKTLNKFTELGVPKTAGIGQKSKQIWKRLTWEPDEVKELRSRLTVNIQFLNAFNGKIAL